MKSNVMSRRKTLVTFGTGILGLSGCLRLSTNQASTESDTPTSSERNVTTTQNSTQSTTESSTTTSSPMKKVDKHESFQYSPRNTGFAPGNEGPDGKPTEKWRFETDLGTEGPPAIRDGVIFTGTRDSPFFALNRSDGSVRWEKSVEYSHARPYPPAIGNGLVFAPIGSMLYGLDQKDGSVQWKIEGGAYGGPAVQEDSVYQVVNGNGGYQLLALDISSGEKKWSSSLPSPIDYKLGAPAVTENQVFVSIRDTLYTISAKNGKVLWKAEFDSMNAPPTVVDDLVVVGGGGDYQVHAFKRSTGEHVWSWKLDITTSESVAYDGERLYIGNGESVYALDPQKGTPIWRHGFDLDSYSGGDFTSPVINEDTMFVGARSKLHAFKKADGTKLWTYKLPADVVYTPVVLDNEIFVPTSHQAILALN